MEIGTASHTAERARVPHHLIDVFPRTLLAPPETLAVSLARPYAASVSAAACRCLWRNGLYLRALVDGLFPAPRATNLSAPDSAI